jgi:hypothetical protein
MAHSIVGTVGHISTLFEVAEQVRDPRCFEAMLAVVKTFL